MQEHYAILGNIKKIFELKKAISLERLLTSIHMYHTLVILDEKVLFREQKTRDIDKAC